MASECCGAALQSHAAVVDEMDFFAEVRRRREADRTQRRALQSEVKTTLAEMRELRTHKQIQADVSQLKEAGKILETSECGGAPLEASPGGRSYLQEVSTVASNAQSVALDMQEFDAGRLHELPMNFGTSSSRQWAASLRYWPGLARSVSPPQPLERVKRSLQRDTQEQVTQSVRKARLHPDALNLEIGHKPRSVSPTPVDESKHANRSSPAPIRPKRMNVSPSRPKCLSPQTSRAKCSSPQPSRAKCSSPQPSRAKCPSPQPRKTKHVYPQLSDANSSSLVPSSSQNSMLPAASKAMLKKPGSKPRSSEGHPLNLDITGLAQDVADPSSCLTQEGVEEPEPEMASEGCSSRTSEFESGDGAGTAGLGTGECSTPKSRRPQHPVAHDLRTPDTCQSFEDESTCCNTSERHHGDLAFKENTLEAQRREHDVIGSNGMASMLSDDLREQFRQMRAADFERRSEWPGSVADILAEVRSSNKVQLAAGHGKEGTTNSLVSQHGASGSPGTTTGAPRPLQRRARAAMKLPRTEPSTASTGSSATRPVGAKHDDAANETKDQGVSAPAHYTLVRLDTDEHDASSLLDSDCSPTGYGSPSSRMSAPLEAKRPRAVTEPSKRHGISVILQPNAMATSEYGSTSVESNNSSISAEHQGLAGHSLPLALAELHPSSEMRIAIDGVLPLGTGWHNAESVLDQSIAHTSIGNEHEKLNEAMMAGDTLEYNVQSSALVAPSVSAGPMCFDASDGSAPSSAWVGPGSSVSVAGSASAPFSVCGPAHGNIDLKGIMPQSASASSDLTGGAGHINGLSTNTGVESISQNSTYVAPSVNAGPMSVDLSDGSAHSSAHVGPGSSPSEAGSVDADFSVQDSTDSKIGLTGTMLKSPSASSEFTGAGHSNGLSTDAEPESISQNRTYVAPSVTAGRPMADVSDGSAPWIACVRPVSSRSEAGSASAQLLVHDPSYSNIELTGNMPQSASFSSDFTGAGHSNGLSTNAGPERVNQNSTDVASSVNTDCRLSVDVIDGSALSTVPAGPGNSRSEAGSVGTHFSLRDPTDSNIELTGTVPQSASDSSDLTPVARSKGMSTSALPERTGRKALNNHALAGASGGVSLSVLDVAFGTDGIHHSHEMSVGDTLFPTAVRDGHEHIGSEAAASASASGAPHGPSSISLLANAGLHRRGMEATVIQERDQERNAVHADNEDKTSETVTAGDGEAVPLLASVSATASKGADTLCDNKETGGTQFPKATEFGSKTAASNGELSGSEGMSSENEGSAPPAESLKRVAQQSVQRKHRKGSVTNGPGSSSSDNDEALCVSERAAMTAAMKGKGKGLSLLAMMPPPARPTNGQEEEKTLVPSPPTKAIAVPAAEGLVKVPPEASDAKDKGKGKGKGPGLPPPPKAKATEPQPAPEQTKAKGKGKAPPPPKAKGKGKGPPPPESKGKAPPPPKAKSKAAAKSSAAAATDEKPKRALAKVKPLGWQKVSAEEGTIWAEADLEGFDISRSTIEALFAWGSSQGLAGKARSLEDKIEKVRLTSEARAMGICIGLHSLKAFSLEVVRDAIMKLDGAVLSLASTELLLYRDVKTGQPTVLPIEEEIAAARAFAASGKSADVLDDASRFLLAVHDVPHLHDRLLLHQFRFSFDSRESNLRSLLATMKGALMQVRSSKKFASILMLVLKTGNLLNDGTSRGDARGFRINTLTQLSQLKQAEQTSIDSLGDGQEQPLRAGGTSLTLMDTLVDIIAAQRQELLDVAEELSHVPAATRIELEDIGRDIHQLRGSLGQISKSASLGGDSANCTAEAKDTQDVFQMLAPTFVSNAEAQLTSLSETLQECHGVYADVATFFGEKVDAAKKSSGTPAHEWLGFINRFLDDLQRAIAAYNAHQEKLRRRAKKKAGASKQSAVRKDKKRDAEAVQAVAKQLPGQEAVKVSSHPLRETSDIQPEMPQSHDGSRASSCSASFRLQGAGFAMQGAKRSGKNGLRASSESGRCIRRHLSVPKARSARSLSRGRYHRSRSHSLTGSRSRGSSNSRQVESTALQGPCVPNCTVSPPESTEKQISHAVCVPTKD
eukprot:TRINITY_DN12584_c0_g5_i1.p1 TRINITY_DN12584_c0_g5~~TRINITY_DN12584_c0_g5_i1.p1  ORF type:complete len:2072 (-),score=347.78 TRINITY_DN12584_c0_g5_i1:125-6292(-)